MTLRQLNNNGSKMYLLYCAHIQFERHSQIIFSVLGCHRLQIYISLHNDLWNWGGKSTVAQFYDSGSGVQLQ